MRYGLPYKGSKNSQLGQIKNAKICVEKIKEGD